MKNPLRRLLPTLILLCTIIVIGTIGYMLLEGWPVMDALYMIITTLFTVGFQEVHPLSAAGRIFTMGIIVFGVGSAIYAGGQVVEIIIEGEILGYRRRRNMEKKIQEMKNHYIICGFGRTGHQVAAEFDAGKVPYVVIDRKPECGVELEQRGVPHIVGDVISDENLEKAGIKVARGLVATSDSDVANVYVTLSARALNPHLYIVARASERELEGKLRTAGANRVISPYYIAGKRMAAWATRPVVSDFFDMVMHGEGLDFGLHEIAVFAPSALADKTLAEADIRKNSGAMILAIHRKDGTFNLQPTATSRIEHGDTIVALGTPEQLELLERMAQ